MYIPMLEAVSEMLKTGEKPEVKCAKIMLDKIIEGMRGTIPITFEEYNEPKPHIPTAPSAKNKPKSGEIEVCVEAGIIQSIKNAKEDTIIQLDGKPYPWKETIGMSFTEGKVL